MMMVMSAVIEVRTYRAKPGMRARRLDLLRTRAFPLQRELWMTVLGPFPSQDDDVGFDDAADLWSRWPAEATARPIDPVSQ
jgi:hypothetical protein